MRPAEDHDRSQNAAELLAAALLERDRAREQYEQLQSAGGPVPERHRALKTYCEAMDAYHSLLDTMRRERRR